MSGAVRLSRVVLGTKCGPSKGRGPLLPKHTGPGFKKGFGAIGLGRHTKKGFFIVNPMLVPSFKVPDLTGFQLKPYVSRKTPVITGAKGYWVGGRVNP
ncbi:unnamed protein product [Vitrella brassicaformis CCMP3155]|uniref:Uncharacterized protein n=1 Tax=Vitrella brassicaformis (strain CCMP3155) TaxID=1169540 RepID=A0A0G4EVW6_VITBC|nr:unnamed protein product [Vitrella brassicaformis CCMP3155]|mmetsp:Transcript_42941/g.107308  ORF Transcript_42941/g.107308 Transcript_42941/m.107308 type:complete len:98 (-) Transcript_42941:630-923(-)|eukprot:CEM02455.1 unnamed protein product [Vitrella brassicaformis CCMP3155]